MAASTTFFWLGKWGEFAQAHYESQGFVKIAEPNVMGLMGWGRVG